MILDKFCLSVPLPQQVLTQHQHGKVLGWLQGLPQLSGEYSLEVPGTITSSLEDCRIEASIIM